MVRKTLGVLLATLMLLPTGVFAAPSTAQLEKQIQMLAQQLEEMREQLEEVQDASDFNSDSVEILEDSAEKWDTASRIRFPGDYRFRMDYSDADTKGYWGAMDIANAVSDMNAVTGMDTQSILGLMSSYTPASVKG